MIDDNGDVRSKARYEWTDDDTERERREEHRFGMVGGSVEEPRDEQ